MEHTNYTTSPNITTRGLDNMADHDFDVVYRHPRTATDYNGTWVLRSRTAPIVAVFELDNKTGELAYGYPSEVAAHFALERLNKLLADHLNAANR